jgi:crotonobetainyl-CoA:carnitine CoA-transferase CaiB-like acyl-CoA transferase
MGAIRGRLTKEPDMVDMLAPTSDGYVAPLVYGYVNWEDFPTMLDCPELADPKFADFKGRHLHINELSEILVREFAKWKKTELVSLAQDFRFPFGMVQTTEDLLNCPQLQERDFFDRIDHPAAGTLPYPGYPYKVDGMMVGTKQRAPLLGEHNVEIYCGRLGYSREDVVLMREHGVI